MLSIIPTEANFPQRTALKKIRIVLFKGIDDLPRWLKNPSNS